MLEIFVATQNIGKQRNKRNIENNIKRYKEGNNTYFSI
jgi:hypothetical protein